jgi:hypothetical protein
MAWAGGIDFGMKFTKFTKFAIRARARDDVLFQVTAILQILELTNTRKTNSSIED